MKLLNNLTSKADTLGYIAGVLAGTPGGVNDLISSIQQIAGGVLHAPDAGQIQTYLQSPYFQRALMGYLAGLGLDVLNVPLIGKYGKTLQKGATSYGVASVALYLFYSMTHSEMKGVNIENEKSMYNRVVTSAPTYY